jgi:WhiB family transcriptional regulator, redox-sensing transcriptional regulator
MHANDYPLPDRSASWREQAACLGADPNLFFPSLNSGHNCNDQALAICTGCPVRTDCLTEALADEAANDGSLPYGTRGGMTAKQRHQLRTQRRRSLR